MPTDRETLLALAERCERATEGSRELSGEIWCALHGHAFIELSPPNYIVIWPAGEPREPWRRRHVAMPPNCTRSLDAALALVDGWLVETLSDEAMGSPGKMAITGCCVVLSDGRDRVVEGQAATRPLACVAAALRARAQETPR